MTLSSKDTHLLEIKNLSISFESDKVLEHLNIHVDEHEFVAILGPSGCGKSTILNVLAGILKPTDGQVFLHGKEIMGMSDHFAYMPQSDLLLPWYRIWENVTLYAKINHNLEDTKKRALDALKTFGLEGYENAYPKQLSGGMRQRAAFLRTVLCNAEILLLDEPFGALDVITRNDMQDWLLQMRKAIPQTILLVTHDIDEALYLANRVIILSNQPTHVIEEIDLHGVEKTRDWLYEQSDLRKKIYQRLRGENRA